MDSADRRILFEAMRSRGLEEGLVLMVEEIYRGEKSAKLMNGRPGR